MCVMSSPKNFETPFQRILNVTKECQNNLFVSEYLMKYGC